eukprot:458699_1
MSDNVDSNSELTTDQEEAKLVEQNETKCIPTKVHVIYNPHSGAKKGVEIANAVFAFLDSHNIEYNAHKTEYAGHAIEIANTIDFDSYDAICSIGGDGTAHETVNGMMQRKDKQTLPLCIIPAGTGNSILCDFGMEDDYNKSLNALVKGETKQVDCGLVNLLDEKGKNKELYMINMIGLGIAIDAAMTADDLRCCCCCCCCCSQCANAFRYNLGALWQIMKGKTYEMDVIIEEKERIPIEFNAFFVMNNQHMGSKMKVAPNASMEDGLLDMLYAQSMNRLQVMELFDQITKCNHMDNPHVKSKQCMKLKIETQQMLRVNVDGELAGTTPMEISVVAKAFQLYCT